MSRKRIPDSQLTDLQKQKRAQRERFMAIHGERVRQEMKERYHRLKKEDPEKIREGYRKSRAKPENKESYNNYHRKYRKRPDSPQLKGEFSVRLRRTAATLEKRMDKALDATIQQSLRITEAARIQAEMRQSGVTPLTTKTAKEYIRSLKTDKSCMDCGNPFPFYVLEFDHRDPTQKSRALSQIRLSDGFFTTADIDAEAAKCDLICSNCHKIRTYNRANESIKPPPAG